MSTRAKRMDKALQSLGWETGSYESRKCLKCSRISYEESDKFCSLCGTKLPPLKSSSGRAEIERAMKYALGEQTWTEFKNERR